MGNFYKICLWGQGPAREIHFHAIMFPRFREDGVETRAFTGERESGFFVFSFVTSLDGTLFRWINEGGQNSFFDGFMPFVTDLKNFTFVLIALGIWILWKERRSGLVFLVFIGVTLAVTDQFSSHLLKDWIGRVRPCHVLENVHLLTDCNTSYSFPSSHAVNIFAAAFFLSQPFRRLSPVLYAIAAIVGYSRVYIGIHYPLDVIGGAGIGLLIAWPMRRMKDWVVNRYITGNG